MSSSLKSSARALVILLAVGVCLGQQCKRVPKKKNPTDCGEYYLCPLNRPTLMHCSVGLAYDTKKGYCDWADLVEDCDVEKFLDFECPEATSYESPGTNQAFAHPTDCAKQLVCVPSAFEDYKKVPRLLSCDHPQVFNPEIGKCDYYKEVKGCEKYYDHLKKKTAPVAASDEFEAGAIPEERRVSRNPTARPVPEVRRTVTTKAKASASKKTSTTTAAPSTTTTRKATTSKPAPATNDEEYEYDDEEEQKQ